MTSLPDVQVNISSTVSQTIRLIPTMPSYTGIRNPQGRLHPPYPRPTGKSFYDFKCYRLSRQYTYVYIVPFKKLTMTMMLFMYPNKALLK